MKKLIILAAVGMICLSVMAGCKKDNDGDGTAVTPIDTTSCAYRNLPEGCDNPKEPVVTEPVGQ